MKKVNLCVFLVPILFISCMNLPSELPPEHISPQTITKVPAIPVDILGEGFASSEILAAFLLDINPSISREYALELACTYIEEAKTEGINSDIAFSQMCLETGFLRFGGLVTPEMNNFCGLGAMSPEQPGERFPSMQTGVRAHIQHLKGYASAEPLKNPLVDPRYKWVKYGSAPTIYDLAGRWAADLEYGNKIFGILQRLYEYGFSAENF